MGGRHEAKPADAARVVAEWVADGTATGLLVRRRHLRYVWPGAVELLIDPGAPSEQRVFGTGQDVSEGGMCVVVRLGLPVGAHVAVRYADEGEACPWVHARVVHAVAVTGGYHLGIEFELD